jgi:hypothetical protein
LSPPVAAALILGGHSLEEKLHVAAAFGLRDKMRVTEQLRDDGDLKGDE